MDIEELELELIDAGLEEIEEEDGVILVTADYTDFGNLSKAFEDLNIEITKATLERIANTPIELSENDLADVQRIIDKLEDDEDVQKVYTNIG
jgi:transcriptional/translational regulatory protein YebC/TACO1